MSRPIKILNYGCTSSAGDKIENFWTGLTLGEDHSQSADPLGRVCLWRSSNSEKKDVCKTLANEMNRAWEECQGRLSPTRKNILKADSQLGVIFASTKGCLEDFIWEDSFDVSQSDPLSPVLKAFLTLSKINAKTSISVSNACTSGISALFLARQWFLQKKVDHVLIIASDKIGPFIQKGFSSLRALTSKKLRSFDQNRDGLQLGEAAAAILITDTPSFSDEKNEMFFSIEGLGFETEGDAVTRPSEFGLGLKKSLASIFPREQTPDLIIAHGTGTMTNDKIEDHVLSDFFGDKILVTGTKWSIGHTLGASVSMDIIAACEAIRKNCAFALGNTEKIDETFKCSYILKNQIPIIKKISSNEISQVLITSLGFGGVNGAVLLRKSVE